MMEKILASIYGLEYEEEITEQNHTENPPEELVAFCGEKSLIKDGENGKDRRSAAYEKKTLPANF
ncbi:MAG: hypothetical protein K2I10_14710 [Lachnospiraceae bacterium]|nr:hypothetical protein [Lachnospiraceae bacterium]